MNYRKHLKDAFIAAFLVTGLFIVVYPVARGREADSRRSGEAQALLADAQRRKEDLLQRACDTGDIVYSYNRFGALPKPVCWKIVCVNAAENIYRERIKCEEEAK